MTLQSDTADLFGLSGTFPRPGWVVLDAAREHRYTGELVFDVAPQVRVYLDQGQIYLAELSTDPPLGTRLIEAGALNATQLEHGAMRVGETEHLGRLFDRVPSIDRQFVTVMIEMMNESCVTELARQQVGGVISSPYQHHMSGIHRWGRSDDVVDLQPGDPLPAPPPGETPVALTAPGTAFDDLANDALIQWDEPSWLDEPIVERLVEEISPVPTPSSETFISTDWADRLDIDGLPTPEHDPFSKPTPLPALHQEPQATFELIWPSGEVDQDFGAVSEVAGEDERDRVGPTARVTRITNAPSAPAAEQPEASDGLWDAETEGPSWGTPTETGADTDALVLSMRRAVASIETGSLDARQQLADTAAPAAAPGAPATAPPESDLPMREASRSEASVWTLPSSQGSASPSVFADIDAVTPEPALEAAILTPVTPVTTAVPDEAPRVSALRRLIGGLRRR